MWLERHAQVPVCEPGLIRLRTKRLEQHLRQAWCELLSHVPTSCGNSYHCCCHCCCAEASRQLKIPMPFLTTIVVPIVGNAAEHASALIFAVKNRMEISLGVAVGGWQLSWLAACICWWWYGLHWIVLAGAGKVC